MVKISSVRSKGSPSKSTNDYIKMKDTSTELIKNSIKRARKEATADSDVTRLTKDTPFYRTQERTIEHYIRHAMHARASASRCDKERQHEHG